jgi:hypothetical protein
MFQKVKKPSMLFGKWENSYWSIGQGRFTMRKDRLEWIISGLNQYRLTEREDLFIKSLEQDFLQKEMLTEQQEDRIESLYKEKSKLIPNKNHFAPKASKIQGKPRVKKPGGKIIP